MSAEFTQSGLKIEGPFENKRNRDSADLLREIVREAYGADQCIVAHHITYVVEDPASGLEGVVEEIPSIDTLIFDHEVAKKLWGESWRAILQELAVIPVPERDQVLAALYRGRPVRRQAAIMNSTDAKAAGFSDDEIKALG